MNLSYNRVIQFLTVVKYMNMGKAAQELYISQPAISASLAKLEQELEVPLFFRDKNKLVLTPQAESLLPSFEAFRSAHDALVDEAKMLAHPHEEQLHISFTGNTYFFSAFDALDLFREFPNISVKMSYVNSERAINMLLTNQTDFALSYYPITHALISTDTIMSESIGLIVPSNYPLASLGHISLADIAKVPLCGLTKKHYFRIYCDQICKSHDVELTYDTECGYRDYYAKILQANEENCFLGTLENFQLNFQPLGSYCFLPIDGNVLYREVGISYRTDRKKQYQYKDFLDYIKNNFEKQNHYVNQVSKYFNSAMFDDE